MSNRALIILILTAVRSGELCGSDGRRGHKTGARWQEFDLETRLWTIPAERMKAGREHVVPLSEHAYALLKWVKAEAMAEAGGDEIPGAQFVFRATRHGTGGWLKPAALGKALSTALPGEAVTVHGMRSAFRDWAGNETATPREVIEEALSHSLGAVESAYRRGAAIEKRRLLMQTWCDYCSPAGK